MSTHGTNAPGQGAVKTAPAIPANCEALMTTEQVAAAMGVTKRQVHLMLSAGKFPSCDLRIGRLARWKVSTFNKWVNSQARE